MIQIGEGLLAQINEVHEYLPIATKENIREALMSISDKRYEELWRETFGETYEEFVNKLLENELEDIKEIEL